MKKKKTQPKLKPAALSRRRRRLPVSRRSGHHPHHPHHRHHPHPAPPTPGFVLLERIIQDFQNDPRPDKKLALAISGGGARGAYEAGAIEALLTAFRANRVAPQIITGTSAGSIVATCLFVDLLFPLAPGAQDPGLPPETAGPVPYASRQSQVWRNIAAGNVGAQQLFGDMSWLVDFVTGKKPWPVIGNLQDEIQVLKTTWAALGPQLTALGAAAQKVINAAGAGAPFFSDIQTALNAVTGGPGGVLQTAVSTLSSDWNSLSLSPLDPSGDYNQLTKIIGDIQTVLDNLPTPSASAGAAISLATSELSSLTSYAQTLAAAVAGLSGPLATVIGSTGRLTGAALEVAACVDAIVTAGTFLLENLLPLIVGILGLEVVAGVVAIECENILPAANMLNLLATVMGGACPAGQTLLTHWRGLAPAGRPELLLAATDMTSQRQMVFAIANPQTLTSFAGDDTWVTDLTRYTDPISANRAITAPPSGNLPPTQIFTPLNTGTMASLTDHALIAKATMTSSALPFAFPPQRWLLGHLDPNTPQPAFPGTRTTPPRPPVPPAMESFLPHIFMDGGIVDNSPIDLAVVAGATHIISFELQPLPSFGDDFGDAYFLRNDNETFGFGKIAAGVFNIGMSGSLIRSIENVVEANAALPARKQLRIYRMAPLVPGAANVGGNSVNLSVGTIDFDGAYNSHNGIIQSVYDWFMQGYVDAQSYAAEPGAGTDPIYDDYRAHQAALGCVGPSSLQFTGNQFWLTGDRPLPGIDDFDRATPLIVLPNFQAMATTPPYNG